MKIILHFGAHKTASTHLQYNLALNRDTLAKHGIKYLKFQEISRLHRQSQSLRENTQNPDYNMEAAKYVMLDEINKAIAGYDAAILSFEGILGPLRFAKQEDVYPQAEEVLKIYRDILKEHKVIPLFFTREYNSFFKSAYKWELKFNRLPIRLDAYLANKNLTPNRWTQIIDCMDKTFSEAPRFFAYEDYKSNSREVFYEIIRLTGKQIDPGELHLDLSKRNRSGNTVSLDFYYTINFFANKISNSERRRLARNFLNRNLSDPAKTKWGKIFLKSHRPKQLKKLANPAHYKKETVQLYSKYGLITKEH